jgi:hypothetical protein
MNHEKPSMFLPAVIGGVFLGVTSALPFINFLNCACCSLVIGGGLLASYFYLKDYPRILPRVSYGEGALLGVYTGLIGAVVWTLVSVPLQYLQLRLGMGMMGETLEEALSDPEIPESVRRIVTAIMAGEGMGIIYVFFTFFSSLGISLIFAIIGAILGVAFFQRRREPPYQSGYGVPPGPPPYQPPSTGPGL